MRQVLRRFAVLGMSSLFTQLVAFAALAVAARRVGPSNLGAYTVALSIITFISLPMSLGMTMVGTRDVAREPDRIREIMGEILVLQLIVAVIGYAAIVLLTPVIASDDAMRRLLPIVGLFLFTGTSFEWALQAMGRMRSIAIARVTGQLVYGALVPVLVTEGLPGMVRYAWLMIAGLAIKHVITTASALRAAGLPDLWVGGARLRRRARASLARSYTSVMMQIYGTIDQIMLGYFSTAFDAGEYSAAYRLPNAVGTFAGSWLAVVFPHSAVLAARDRNQLRAHSGRMLSVVALFVVPLVVCTPFVAHGLIVAAFGAQYGPAATAFALLMVATGLSVVDSTLGAMMTGMGNDRFAVKIVTTTALFNVAVNLVVIPLFGRDGAAIDTIVSEMIAFVIVVRGINGMLGGLRPEWGRIGRILLASGPAVLTLVLMPGSVSVWLRILAGALAYLFGTLAFGAVVAGEIRALLGNRRPRRAPRGAAARPV